MFEMVRKIIVIIADGPLAHSKVGSGLKRRAAGPADHGGAVTADERICYLPGTGWTIKRIGGLWVIDGICHKVAKGTRCVG